MKEISGTGTGRFGSSTRILEFILLPVDMLSVDQSVDRFDIFKLKEILRLFSFERFTTFLFVKFK